MKNQGFHKQTVFFLFSIQLLSVYLFTKGFFLVRETLPNINQDLGEIKTIQSRVILILIDALRIDFTTYDSFSFLKERLENNPNQTNIFISVADSPTVTLQRIQAINTGNIPSFINLKANFNADAIKEDNLIWSLKRQNRTTVFTGDDTWGLIFPDSFTRMYPEDSFDVFDLDTVDNTVIKQINANIEEKDWTYMIGHLLGLDHVGHTFDASHPNIDKKLKQYSDFLTDIYEKMDNETMLVIIGDHGMTSQGNHGGQTEEETNTVITSFLKGENRRFYQEFSKHLQNLSKKHVRWETTNFLFNSVEQNSSLVQRNHFIRRLSQIDLVPTLAVTMGVPIPYNNIGMFIPEFLVVSDEENERNILKRCLKICQANLNQMWNYVTQLQESIAKFPLHKIEFWSRINSEIMRENPQEDQQYLWKILQTLSMFEDVQQVARKIWNEYDYPLMYLSILLMIYTSFIAVFYISFTLGIEIGNANPFDLSINQYMFVTVILVFCTFFWSVLQSLTILGFVLCSYYLKYLNKQRKLILLYEQTKTNYSQPIISLIVKIFKKVLSPISIHSALWFGLKIGYGDIVFSLKLLRMEDFALFSYYLINFIPFIIYESIFVKVPHLGWTFLHIFTFILAEQFDLSINKEYYVSILRLIEYKKLFNNPWVTIIIPSICTHYLLYRYIQEMNLNSMRLILRISNKLKNQFKDTHIQQILHFSLFLTQIYYGIVFFGEYQSSYFHEIFLPRLIYLISLLGIIYSCIMGTQYIKVLLPLFCNFNILNNKKVSLPLYLVFGYQSLVLLPLYFISLYSLVQLAKSSSAKENQIYFWGCLGFISNYFWFMMGNRCQVSSVNVDKAYIGFKKFNFFITGFFLMLNQLGLFFLLGFLIPLISETINEKRENKENLPMQIVMYQTHYMTQAMLSAINCLQNTEELMLIGAFIPKYIFDGIIFIGVTIFSFQYIAY